MWHFLKAADRLIKSIKTLTINLKGSPNPKKPKLVKLEVFFYKSGHSRVTKSLKDIKGFIKDWDEENQTF
jgi:hypothetical protein